MIIALCQPFSSTVSSAKRGIPTVILSIVAHEVTRNRTGAITETLARA